MPVFHNVAAASLHSGGVLGRDVSDEFVEVSQPRDLEPLLGQQGDFGV